MQPEIIEIKLNDFTVLRHLKKEGARKVEGENIIEFSDKESTIRHEVKDIRKAKKKAKKWKTKYQELKSEMEENMESGFTNPALPLTMPFFGGAGAWGQQGQFAAELIQDNFLGLLQHNSSVGHHLLANNIANNSKENAIITKDSQVQMAMMKSDIMMLSGQMAAGFNKIDCELIDIKTSVAKDMEILDLKAQVRALTLKE